MNILSTLKMAAAGIAAAVLTYGAMAAWDRWVDDPAVYAAGEYAERLRWETLVAKMRAEAAERERIAQRMIDEAERKYLEERAGDALKIAALEDALKEAEDDAKNSGGDRPPAFTRGVSRAINAIGR